MGRGESDILFGRPLLIKKEAFPIPFFQQRFPGRVSALAATRGGFFLLDEEKQLHSLDHQGEAVKSFKPFSLHDLGFGQKQLSLTESAISWITEDENIFYKNIHHDLHLDSQSVPFTEPGETLFALQAAQGNALYLLTEGKDPAGKTRAKLWQTRIDPTMAISNTGWEAALPADRVIHGIKTSDQGMWLFLVREEFEGEDRPEIAFIPVSGPSQTWDFFDIWEGGYSPFYSAQKLLHYDNKMLYSQGDQVMAFALDNKHGEARSVFSAASSVFDIALQGDLLAVLEEKTVTLLDLTSSERIATFDINDAGHLISFADDLLLYRLGEESYFLFPDFFKR